MLGVVQFFRTRARTFLWFIGAGALVLFALLFLASRFALQLFGVLPLALELQTFATENVLPLGVGIGGGAAAVAILFFARQRFALAFGAMVFGAMVLFFAIAQTSHPPTPSTPEHPGIAQITLPEKFRAQIFASEIQEPSALAFDDAGNLYYGELVDGNIVRLRDTNGDGRADEKRIFASNFKNPRGLAWHDDALYVSSRGQINALRDTNGDGVADANELIRDHLFSLDIQHSNNGIAFGPDGKLYLAIGGPRVGQLELEDKTYRYQGQPREEWQFAGILQMDADGKNPKLFARGLRNPYGLAFDGNGNLFATDNGDETIPVPDGDELNLIEEGADYGYPYFFGIPPPWSETRAPILRFAPHTAPTGVVAYTAKQFPKEFRNAIFVALYWIGRTDGTYREVVAVSQAKENDQDVWVAHDFVKGLDRPVALASGPDGALYIADMRGGKADADAPGAIYRITYSGE